MYVYFFKTSAILLVPAKKNFTWYTNHCTQITCIDFQREIYHVGLIAFLPSLVVVIPFIDVMPVQKIADWTVGAYL
jgi:hypothetical protein